MARSRCAGFIKAHGDLHHGVIGGFEELREGLYHRESQADVANEFIVWTVVDELPGFGILLDLCDFDVAESFCFVGPLVVVVGAGGLSIV